MTEYLRASEALRTILDAVPPAGSETIGLEQSLGRVLAQTVCANRDLPPYDVSAMDGFAVRSCDTTPAPVALEIIEDVRAGVMPKCSLQAGQCARIMTGARLPAGADAVVRVEDTQELGPGRLQIGWSLIPGQDVRLRGEGMRSGDVLLQPGTEITPGVMGVLATVKAARLAVYRRPSVAILSTGDELEGLHDAFDANKIPESNAYALLAQVQALGVEPVLLGIARDDPQELGRHLETGLQYDVLLVSGGTSVGVHDYVRPTLEELGVQMRFWRVAIKPGHPLAFGMRGRNMVFGLPGNPVSSMVCFEEFVLPALRRMMGAANLYRRTVYARLAHAIKSHIGRTEFMRVRIVQEATGHIASTTGTQSSGVLLSMAQADGLLVVPAASGDLAAGTQVSVQLLDGTAFQCTPGFKE